MELCVQPFSLQLERIAIGSAMNSKPIWDYLQLPRSDPSLAEYPLLDSIWPVIMITFGYFLFVLKLGPMFMKSRRPYNVKNLMLAYNIIQVIYNGTLLAFSTYYMIIRPTYDWRCMVKLPLDHPDKAIERRLTHMFYLNKLLDLLDTVFFILRKSYKQLTILHLYHHSIMFVGTYVVVTVYGSGGQYAIMAFINSLVHCIMYFYYLISALYPEMKNKLWWKKYITQLQLIQFVFHFVYALSVMILNPDCQFPIVLQYAQLAQAIILSYMFGKFYYTSYIRPKKQQKQQKHQ